MANYKTGAQRYNDRMDKIFEQAKKSKADRYFETMDTANGLDMNGEDGQVWLSTKSMLELQDLLWHAKHFQDDSAITYLEQVIHVQDVQAKNGKVIRIM